MDYERWMVDTETAGDQPGGVILSIGWVRFTPSGVDHHTAQEVRICIQDQLDMGQKVDGATLDWWLQKEALPWTEGCVIVSPTNAIALYDNSLKRANEVWAKPPGYDLAGIRALAKCVHREQFQPHWRSDRCFRTLAAMTPKECCLPSLEKGVRHGALVDTIHQAEECVSMLRWIYQRTEEK